MINSARRFGRHLLPTAFVAALVGLLSACVTFQIEPGSVARYLPAKANWYGVLETRRDNLLWHTLATGLQLPPEAIWRVRQIFLYDSGDNRPTVLISGDFPDFVIGTIAGSADWYQDVFGSRPVAVSNHGPALALVSPGLIVYSFQGMSGLRSYFTWQAVPRSESEPDNSAAISPAELFEKRPAKAVLSIVTTVEKLPNLARFRLDALPASSGYLNLQVTLRLQSARPDRQIRSLAKTSVLQFLQSADLTPNLNKMWIQIDKQTAIVSGIILSYKQFVTALPKLAQSWANR